MTNATTPTTINQTLTHAHARTDGLYGQVRHLPIKRQPRFLLPWSDWVAETRELICQISWNGYVRHRFPRTLGETQETLSPMGLLRFAAPRLHEALERDGLARTSPKKEVSLPFLDWVRSQWLEWFQPWEWDMSRPRFDERIGGEAPFIGAWAMEDAWRSMERFSGCTPRRRAYPKEAAARALFRIEEAGGAPLDVDASIEKILRGSRLPQFADARRSAANRWIRLVWPTNKPKNRWLLDMGDGVTLRPWEEFCRRDTYAEALYVAHKAVEGYPGLAPPYAVKIRRAKSGGGFKVMRRWEHTETVKPRRWDLLELDATPGVANGGFQGNTRWDLLEMGEGVPVESLVLCPEDFAQVVDAWAKARSSALSLQPWRDAEVTAVLCGNLLHIGGESVALEETPEIDEDATGPHLKLP
jgi:hypothetical protein